MSSKHYFDGSGWKLDRAGEWYDDHFLWNGQPHQLGAEVPRQTIDGSPAEAVSGSLSQRVAQVHEQSGPIAAACTARAMVVSDLRFVWRPNLAGDDRRVFGTPALDLLERPAGGVTRSGLLYRLELDVCYAGNAYLRRGPEGVVRLRPDWTAVLVDDEGVLIGYAYYRGGDKERAPELLTPAEVAHWAPEPLPDKHYLGGSWVTAVLREHAYDQQATSHMSKYFDNAATANMVITAADGVTREQFEAWVDSFENNHAGSGNAWRNIYMSPGTDVKVVGSSLAELELKGLQGGFENRVSVRSRVPATVLGIREGMVGSALNSGNYSATRRMWADSWFSPYASTLCEAVERLLTVPVSSALTFDPSRVLLLQEDILDAAEIRQKDATTLDALYRAGFDPDASVQAVLSGDFNELLGNHTGLPSVQANAEVNSND